MNGAAGGLKEAFERFSAMERDANLHDFRIAGIAFWPFIRFWMFSQVIMPQLLKTAAPHPDFNLPKGRRGLCRFVLEKAHACRLRLLAQTYYNPLLSSRRCDVLFSMTPRMAKLADGRRLRSMTDFVAPYLQSSVAILERRQSGRYLESLPGPRVFWAGALELAAAKYRKTSDFANLGLEIDRNASDIAALVSDVFGVEVKASAVGRQIGNAVSGGCATVPLARRMLRRMKVKCLVTAVHYSRMNLLLAQAAHLEGVPVAELQHGTVYPEHPAYNLPCLDPEHSPDWLLTWGSYWSGRTRNYALSGTVETGYPLLEYWHNVADRSGEERKTVLFISQGTIGMELSRKAIELQGLIGERGLRVVYKLHPNETLSWRRLYPWLLDSGVEVVDNVTRGVYSLFGEALAVVGVYSTAVIEAMMWDLPAYVFRQLPGGDTMVPFFDSGAIRPVDTVAELAAGLTDGILGRMFVDGDRFWVPNARENIVRAIDSLAKKGHP